MIQFLSYYLPQYHTIPENDKWWGEGFTEWTNVKKAQPLFKNHYQPIIPADLGYYDLRNPEIQESQSRMALEYGIDGFIYYQYFFGNKKMLLEEPAEQMLKNKNITIPFCFCWANESWKGVWHGKDDNEVLIEQVYNGEQEYRDYFDYLLPFFKDERYIKVDNKPMFHIYRIESIPNYSKFLELFNNLALANGFEGIYFVATLYENSEKINESSYIKAVVGLEVFNKIRYGQFTFFKRSSLLGKIESKIQTFFGNYDQVGKRLKPLILDYSKGIKKLSIKFPSQKYIACVFPNWDNSARSKNKSLIFKNATPQSWELHLKKAFEECKKNANNPQFIVIKSWNEWAEGNYLEPDVKYGHSWLQAIKNVKFLNYE